MSVASKNLFDLLGEETPAATTTEKKTAASRDKKRSDSPPVPRELVAQSTTSRKRDPNQPTPRERTVNKKADQPRRRRQAPQGNEAFAREGKEARANNAAHPVDATGAPSNRRNARARRGREFDRHSQTGRVDTKKATERGWGDLVNSAANPDVAENEGNTPSGAQTPAAEEENVKTLDEYLSERKSAAKPVGRTVEKLENATKVEKSAPEELFASLKKSASQKKSAVKESKPKKVLLDIEQTFTARPARGGRPNRAPRRGPSETASKTQQAPPTLSETDFPALA
ncbi:Serpine1 like protein [Schizosaccharomyces pombe]